MMAVSLGLVGLLADRSDGLPGYDQLLVGRYNPQLDIALVGRATRDSVFGRIIDTAFFVPGSVPGIAQGDSEFAESMANRVTNRRGVFSDATGKDHRIGATKGNEHRAELASDFGDKDIDCELCFGVSSRSSRFEIPHIA
jgi:hypothetical protein